MEQANGYPIKVLKTVGCQGNQYRIVLLE